MTRRATSLGLATALLATVALATSSCESFNDYCSAKMDCEHGNDNDIDACEVGLEADSDKASLYGCSEYFDTWTECITDKSRCNSADPDYTDDGNCNREAEEYGSCMSG